MNGNIRIPLERVSNCLTFGSLILRQYGSLVSHTLSFPRVCDMSDPGLSEHREHTILLSRESKQRNEKNEHFAFVSSCHLLSYAILLGNCFLQILRNTEVLNSYPGLTALRKKFFVCIKFDKGGNSLPKHFDRTANIHSNL